MATTAKNHRLGSRGRPEETRASILEAATREFAQEGVAGARTDAIARAARVNKALLYYYFKDKETLYGAVVPRIAQREWMSAGRNASPHLKRIVHKIGRAHV